MESVVPYVGTWIEICRSCRDNPLACGRSLRGNVDRNDEMRMLDDQIENRRSLRGNVDRNQDGDMFRMRRGSRSLRGNVDRNIKQPETIRMIIMSFPTWERG